VLRIAQRQVELVRLARVRGIVDDDPKVVALDSGASAAPIFDRQLDVRVAQRTSGRRQAER
jgi:hypothetical protein